MHAVFKKQSNARKLSVQLSLCTEWSLYFFRAMLRRKESLFSNEKIKSLVRNKNHGRNCCRCTEDTTFSIEWMMAELPWSLASALLNNYPIFVSITLQSHDKGHFVDRTEVRRPRHQGTERSLLHASQGSDGKGWIIINTWADVLCLLAQSDMPFEQWEHLFSRTSGINSFCKRR